MEAYHSTHIGISEEVLVKTYGQPQNIFHQDSGVIIYEYIERFQMGMTEKSIVEIRRYYFYIKDGKVSSKQVRIFNQPAYEHMNQL